MSVEQRFKDKMSSVIQVPHICWPWPGMTDSHGYGYITDGKKSVMTHKLSYQLSVGPIPDKMVLENDCGNKSCANPSHWMPRLKSGKRTSSVLNPKSVDLKVSTDMMVKTSSDYQTPKDIEEEIRLRPKAGDKRNGYVFNGEDWVED